MADRPSEDSKYHLSFSHVGFFVTDMPRLADFYSRILGFFITDQGLLNGREVTFLSRDPDEHHQIVLVSGRDPAAQQNINQISFRLPSLGELKALYETLVSLEVKGLDPTLHGNAWSIYFLDPEGNRIEAFTDSDWYIPQPIKEPLDLTQSEAEIRRATRRFCEARTGFKPIAQWRAEMRERMKSALSS